MTVEAGKEINWI